MGTAEDEGYVDVSFMLHCAVYALLQNGKVVYVGQSKNPLTRVYSHASYRGKLEPWKAGYTTRKVGFKFDTIWVMPCMLRDLDRLEAEQITKWQPKHNTRGRKPNTPLDLNLLMASVSARIGPPVEAPIRRRV